jgi:hypothetical protein
LVFNTKGKIVKTPENFNHNPNVGLTSMAANNGMYDASVLKYDNAPMGAVDMSAKSNGKVDKSVLSFKNPDIAGTNEAK